jgi:GT2 family glycosyltransferase
MLTSPPVSLSKVALAISAYRSDEQVIELLRIAFAPDEEPFGAVIVVDSLGTGAILRAANAHGWSVSYINADHNLGSAGNLDLRLRTAAELSLEWCFAVNHDGVVEPRKIERLLSHADRPKVGAVYPELIFSHADRRRDVPRRKFRIYGLLGPRARAANEDDPCIEVAWSSSNCALYRLDAFRTGASTWPHLWMGFEDLAIGWELRKNGWTQLLCTDVQVIDDYEFRRARIFGHPVYLTQKPVWYAYYHLRNLLIIARETKGEAIGWFDLAVRMVVDVTLVLLFRDQKLDRLRLLFKGLSDGWRGMTGKGPVP